MFSVVPYFHDTNMPFHWLANLCAILNFLRWSFSTLSLTLAINETMHLWGNPQEKIVVELTFEKHCVAFDRCDNNACINRTVVLGVAKKNISRRSIQ